jgi:hypothetical protein
MNLTNEEVHECLTLLRELSDRPRCSRIRMTAIVILSVIVGALLGAIP